MRVRLLLVLVPALLWVSQALVPAHAHATGSIDVIDVPASTFDVMSSISRDGESVAGLVDPYLAYRSQAFVWRLGTIELVPMAHPPGPPPLGPESQWHGQVWLSEDGETIVVAENALQDTSGSTWTIRGYAWRNAVSTLFKSISYSGFGDSTYSGELSGISGDANTAYGFRGSSFHGIPGEWPHVTDTVSGVGDSLVLSCPPGYYAPESSPALFAGASDASRDGGIVVGHHSCLDLSTYSGGEVPFRWDRSVATYPTFGGVTLFGEARFVSADGLVVAGTSDTPFGVQSWIWSDDVVTFVKDLPGMSGSLPRVTHLSDDGQVVVGTVATIYGRLTFRWQDDSMQLIEFPAGLYESEPTAINDDGSVIVGLGNTVDGEVPYYWSVGAGLRSLRDVLELETGLDLSDWVLETARGLSGDGLVVIGEGVYLGEDVGYRAELEPAAPVPGVAASSIGRLALVSAMIVALCATAIVRSRALPR